MSGEWLDEVCYGLSEYRFEDLGRETLPFNPMLGQLLMDLREPIHTLNYWQSGDCSQSEHAEAWRKFSEKWLNSTNSIEVVKENIMKDVEEKLNTALGIKNGDM